MGRIRGAIHLMYKVYRYILPEVERELGRWRRRAEQIPSPELRQQALNSMYYKKFHCQGGAIYALLAPAFRSTVVRLIVAFQTISDYLDNLCDRSTSMLETDFRQLHQSMLDAVDPSQPLSPYYQYHPERDDGGYLAALVRVCQEEIARLPGYRAVYPEVERLVRLYTDMQTYKHIAPAKRVEKLQSWYEAYRENNGQEVGELYWNEFAAACGSTLGVFALLAAAGRPDCDEQLAQAIRKAYFPWMCGLHILLDYFIDQEEDRIGGDLNFVTAYADDVDVMVRLRQFAQRASELAGRLPEASFHRLIVEGLLGLYLSNNKVKEMAQGQKNARQLLKERGWRAQFFYLNGRLLMGDREQTQPGRS